MTGGFNMNASCQCIATNRERIITLDILGEQFYKLTKQTFSFIEREFHGMVPTGVLNFNVQTELKGLYDTIGNLYETDHQKDVMQIISDFLQMSQTHWDCTLLDSTNYKYKEQCKDALFTSVQMIANVAVLLYPSYPELFSHIIEIFQLNTEWHAHYVVGSYRLPKHCSDCFL